MRPKISVHVIGGPAEGLACADPGVRRIGVSRFFFIFFFLSSVFTFSPKGMTSEELREIFAGDFTDTVNGGTSETVKHAQTGSKSLHWCDYEL